MKLATKVFYRNVLAAEVDPAKVRAAARVLAFLEKRLGLPPITVVWVEEIAESTYNLVESRAAVDKAWQAFCMVAAGRPDCSYKDSPAFVDEDGGFGAKVHPFGSGGSTIYLNEAEPEGRIGFNVAHECKHLADWKAGLQAGLYADPAVRQRLEDRANEFGREIEKELAR